MKEIKNILVIRTDRIGDVVLTIPAVRALKKAFPKSWISFWVSETTRELAEGLPYINEVLVENTSRGWGGYFDFVGKLMDKDYDLVINYHPKRRTNSACFLAGIPLRVGYRNNKFGFLLNRSVIDTRHLGEKHEAEYCLDLLQKIGVVSSDLTLELAVNKEAEAWTDQFFARRNLAGRKLVAMHPDASCPTKCWPVKSFGELADRLASSLNVIPLIIGSLTARPQVAVIGEQMHHDYFDLTGSLSLAQLVSLLRRCHLLVSNDSGPVHIAAAVGIPVISLFLRGQPGINHIRWKPLGSKSVVLLNKPGEEIVLDKKGQVVGGKFDSISIEEVFVEAVRLLHSTPRAD